MSPYLLLAVVVLGVNLLPVLGPPTWLVLVLFRVNEHLALVPLVLVGAVAATSGRVVLALSIRRLGAWLPQRFAANVEAAGRLLTQRQRNLWAGLGVFLLSPLPSAQLFEAAGLMRLRLLPLVSAFFVGRVVSYSLYAGAATAADRSLGGALSDGLTSWPSLALQGGLLLAMVLLGRIDWTSRATAAA